MSWDDNQPQVLVPSFTNSLFETSSFPQHGTGDVMGP